MAISILDTDLITASGDITIPSGCTYIYALVFDSVNPPSINGSVMSKIAGVPATSKISAVSAHWFEVTEDDVTVPFVMSGTHNTLFYLSGAGMYRDNVLKGTSVVTGILAGVLAAAVTDLAIGIMAGMIGACTIKGDSTEFAYLRNDTYLKTGYLTPGDTSLSCEIKDVGVSAGYVIHVPSIYHPAVLIKAAWDSYEQVTHYVTAKFDHYLYGDNPSHTPPFPIIAEVYKWYIDGVYQGFRTVPPGTGGGNYTYQTTELVHHPAEYSDAWTETFPDITVPGGEQAQVNGIVVLIQTGAAMEFVPKIIMRN